MRVRDKLVVGVVALALLVLVVRFETDGAGQACQVAGVGVGICFINPAHRWQ